VPREAQRCPALALSCVGAETRTQAQGEGGVVKPVLNSVKTIT
jgi:hypothetical protein